MGVAHVQVAVVQHQDLLDPAADRRLADVAHGYFAEPDIRPAMNSRCISR